MIIATGIDMVEIARVRILIRDFGERFVNRWFSPTEINYCRLTSDPARHYAARLAAKEATIKTLGIQWVQPICWKYVTVNQDSIGAPFVEICGFVLEAARRRNITALHLSLSHTKDCSIASIVAEFLQGRADTSDEIAQGPIHRVSRRE